MNLLQKVLKLSTSPDILKNIVDSNEKISIRDFEKSCKRFMLRLYEHKDGWRVRDSLPKDYSKTVEDILHLDPKFVVEEWDNCVDNSLKMKFIQKNKKAIISLFK